MRVILFIFLLCISFVTIAQDTKPAEPNTAAVTKKKERRFRGMIIAGFNACQVDGDRMAGYYKFGFNGGVGAFAMISKRFSISAELLYSMKGGKNTITSSKYSTRNITLDYAEAPIMFNYHDRKVAIFGAGFSMGGLVRNKQVVYNEFGTQQQYVNIKDATGNMVQVDLNDEYFRHYRKYEFAVVAHATFLIKNIVAIQARFQYSMIPIATNLPDGNLKNGNQWNNVLSLRAMYLF